MKLNKLIENKILPASITSELSNVADVEFLGKRYEDYRYNSSELLFFKLSLAALTLSTISKNDIDLAISIASQLGLPIVNKLSFSDLKKNRNEVDLFVEKVDQVTGSPRVLLSSNGVTFLFIFNYKKKLMSFCIYDQELTPVSDRASELMLGWASREDYDDREDTWSLLRAKYTEYSKQVPSEWIPFMMMDTGAYIGDQSFIEPSGLAKYIQNSLESCNTPKLSLINYCIKTSASVKLLANAFGSDGLFHRYCDYRDKYIEVLRLEG